MPIGAIARPVHGRIYRASGRLPLVFEIKAVWYLPLISLLADLNGLWRDYSLASCDLWQVRSLMSRTCVPYVSLRWADVRGGSEFRDAMPLLILETTRTQDAPSVSTSVTWPFLFSLPCFPTSNFFTMGRLCSVPDGL